MIICIAERTRRSYKVGPARLGYAASASNGDAGKSSCAFDIVAVESVHET